ncbi:MAG TPA: BamA/TamA family outer membrane protein [Casimicrobiaceae bacterium]|nr:BamA/TamA family outer membrane protein [Casimicrobiaceae bacterium]
MRTATLLATLATPCLHAADATDAPSASHAAPADAATTDAPPAPAVTTAPPADTPAETNSASPVGPSAGPAGTASAPRADAFRYRLVIDAPSALESVLRANVGLARWQDFSDMTGALFDALARDAINETKDAAAAAGWFSASAEVRVDPKTTPATVTLVLTPGAPTLVRDVRIDVDGPATSDGPAAAEAIARLRDEWKLPHGEVFTQARWAQSKTDAVRALARGGFAAAKITASQAAVDPEAAAADLQVTIASGPRFHVGELRIRGLKRYPESVVRNFSTLKPGDDYDAEALDTLVRRLSASGYFASVQAEVVTEAATAGAAPIDIAVIEAPTRRLDAGIGYSTDTRFRANASWRNVDIDGRATQLAIDARLEQDVSSLSVRLTKAPNDTGWIDGVLGEIERTDISNLITETAVAGVRRQSVDMRDNWAFGAAYYFDRQEPEGAPDITSHALYVDAVRTWRRTDDLIAPTRGYNFALQAGVGPPGVSTRSFGRVIAQFAAWQPLARDITLSLRAEAGAVIAGAREGIPSALLFRTGGDSSVRGYAFESLGVKSGDAVVPGRYYAVTSAEATKWIGDNWGIAVFADAGNAVDSPRDLSHLALGYGVGGRLRTPIGPFRLDLAYGQDVHRVRVHFSVGLAF